MAWIYLAESGDSPSPYLPGCDQLPTVKTRVGQCSGSCSSAGSVQNIDGAKMITLLILFQVKHFLADFPLQTPYMLGKFKAKGWVGPLASHAGVHAFLTLIIGASWGFYTIPTGVIAALAAFDFASHFTIDRIKANPKMGGRWKALSADEFKSTLYLSKLETPNHEISMAAESAQRRLDGNTYFWWALGADQMAHHLTHYFIIWILVS